MPVKHLADATLRALAKSPPEHGTQIDYYDDPSQGGTKGLLLKHSYGGTLTFYAVYYDKAGKSKQHKLGRYPALKLADARIKAQRLQLALHDDREYLTKQKQAEIEAEAKRVTFAMIVEKFKKLYIEKNKLRTGKVMIQQIDKHLMPKFRDHAFNLIKRREIAEHLDKIEAAHGASMADSVLAILRSISNFVALRDEDYVSPFVRGMKRYKSTPRKRALIDDAEIKAFWHATETLGTYGALARVCLLTGQRRAKVNHMKWTDIDAEGVWRLGHTPREKPNCGAIKLPPFVLALIKAQPRLEKNPYVFPALRKRGPFNAFGQLALTMTKREREILPDMAPHTVHDLRRSFRSICPRLGIDRDIAERCLGHTIGNAIERTYDQYPYLDEMGHAFATFARHIQTVVSPPPANVVDIRAGGRRGRVRAQAPLSGTP